MIKSIDIRFKTKVIKTVKKEEKNLNFKIITW